MSTTRADLILHPVRMRILLALAGRKLTASQLAAGLNDVPQATLYRHIKTLANAGILVVVEERQVRGATEKIYTLQHGAAMISQDEMAKATPEDHLRYFIAFIATVMDDFSRYVHSDEPINPMRDGVSYNRIPLYLSDDELIEMSRLIQAAILPRLNNKPAPDRRRRDLISILVPVADEPPPLDE